MFTHSKYESKVQVYDKNICIYVHPKSQSKFKKKSATKKIKQKGASARNEELGSGECAEICNGESKKLRIKPILFLNLLLHFSIF